MLSYFLLRIEFVCASHLKIRLRCNSLTYNKIFQLNATELKELIELEQLCFDYHWTPEQFLMGLERGIYTILGVRIDGQLAGYIAFSLVADEMEILNLAVHPNHRKLGLGTRLLEKTFDMCIRRGIKTSFLDVKASNEPAIQLYKKFGYVKIGIRKKYYPDTKEDALLYRYDFSTTSTPI